MTAGYSIGSTQEVEVASETDLLDTVESALDFCLDAGDVFAIFKVGSGMCQILLTPEGDMHAETSLGELAAHAGFHEDVPDWPAHQGNVLPADWHSRAKMVAGAMTRAFVDAGKMEFPGTVSVAIHPTNARLEARPPEPAPVEGARTIGFAFGEDQTMGWFVDRLAPTLGLESADASIHDVQDAIQQQLEAEHGPLARTDRPYQADIRVELTGSGWSVVGAEPPATEDQASGDPVSADDDPAPAEGSVRFFRESEKHGVTWRVVGSDGAISVHVNHGDGFNQVEKSLASLDEAFTRHSDMLDFAWDDEILSERDLRDLPLDIIAIYKSEAPGPSDWLELKFNGETIDSLLERFAGSPTDLFSVEAEYGDTKAQVFGKFVLLEMSDHETNIYEIKPPTTPEEWRRAADDAAERAVSWPSGKVVTVCTDIYALEEFPHLDYHEEVCFNGTSHDLPLT